MGRPCRALGVFGGGLTQGLVALAGLRTLGSGRIAPLGLACPFVGSLSKGAPEDCPQRAGACGPVRRQSVWRALLACRISLFASLPCACLPLMELSPYRGDPIQSPGCVALQGRPNPGVLGQRSIEPYRDDPPKVSWCCDSLPSACLFVLWVAPVGLLGYLGGA